MTPSDNDLRRHLVGVGLALGTKRYVGQHPTEAAHEFANNMLPVLKGIEDRIVKRLKEAS